MLSSLSICSMGPLIIVFCCRCGNRRSEGRNCSGRFHETQSFFLTACALPESAVPDPSWQTSFHPKGHGSHCLSSPVPRLSHSQRFFPDGPCLPPGISIQQRRGVRHLRLRDTRHGFLLRGSAIFPKAKGKTAAAGREWPLRAGREACPPQCLGWSYRHKSAGLLPNQGRHRVSGHAFFDIFRFFVDQKYELFQHTATFYRKLDP